MLSPRARASLAVGLLAGALTTAAALAPVSATDGGRATAQTTAATRAAERRSDRPPVVTQERIQATVIATAEAAATAEAVAEAAAADAAERDMRANPRASRDGGLRPFVAPAAGAMTGWFGEPRGGRAHLGLDLDGETGDPVYAAGPGTVTHAGAAPAGYSGYGLTLMIDHGEGVLTVYAHLSRVDVAPGQRLDAAEVVGAIGTTGAVTGSHLHFEVRVDGVLVDPAPWIAGT